MKIGSANLALHLIHEGKIIDQRTHDRLKKIRRCSSTVTDYYRL